MNFGAGIARMIERRGRNVTFRRESTGGYDPATDTHTPPGDPDTATVKAIITGVDAKMAQADSSIVLTDKTVVIGDIGWEPRYGDLIVDGAHTLKIVSIYKRVQVADKLVGWALVGRA